MDQYNLNEKSKTRNVLKIVGPITLGVGLLFLIIAMVDFFGIFNGNGGFPTLFFLVFIGLPLIEFGAVLTFVGNRKGMPRYTTNRPRPSNLANIDYRYGPTASKYKNAPEDSAPENNPSNPKKVKCRSCGGLSNPGTTYCSHCGQLLR